MHTVFLLLNALLAAAVCIGDFLLYIPRKGARLKAALSGGFVAMGAVNLVYALLTRQNAHYAAVLLAGLILALLGDVILEKNFALGAGCFAGGHVLYALAWNLAVTGWWMDAVLGGAILGIAAAALLHPAARFADKGMRMVTLGYAVIISMMLGKAISALLLMPCAFTLLISCGALLFFVSDALLLVNLRHPSRLVDALSIGAYYPAQCLLAFSPLLLCLLPTPFK